MSVPAGKPGSADGIYVEPSENPESRLMLAVLSDALVTFQRGLDSHVPERRKRFCEVDQWISESNTEWPFSFESICHTLHIDPDYIRTGLRLLKYESLSQRTEKSAPALRRETIYDRRSWRGQIG